MRTETGSGLYSRLRSRIGDRNTAVFLFCLLLSGMFWAMNTLSLPYSATMHVRVSFSGLPTDRLVLGADSLPMTLSVKASGYRLLLNRLNPALTEMAVDLRPGTLRKTRTGATEQYMLISTANMAIYRAALPAGYELSAISPDTVVFSLAQKATRMVPVRVTTNLSFAEGHGLGAPIAVSPAQIELSGPSQILDTLTEVVVGPLVLQDLSEPVQTDVPLPAGLRSLGLRTGTSVVSVRLEVSRLVECRLRIAIALTDEGRDRTVRLLPDSTEVVFQVPMARYKEVYADLFMAEARLTDSIAAHSTSVRVHLPKAPEWASHVRIDPEQVEFIILK
jgi:hypothetical protein